ncbi:MAG: hypothetical protein PVF49_07625 [Anaerolineales bacterium]|jgi:hypothetical protein
MSSDTEKTSRKGAAGLTFVGILLIGLAAGLLTGEVAVGILGGLGIGFIGMAIVRSITGQW